MLYQQYELGLPVVFAPSTNTSMAGDARVVLKWIFEYHS